MRWISSIIWVVLAVLFITPTWPVRADIWSSFYTSDDPILSQPTTASQSCVAAILRAQEQYKIPDNLLLAIGIQEAGRRVDGEVTVWPWTVNAEGTGMFFETREQAMDWVRSQKARGARSIDVGCMQINLHWHRNAFSSLEEAFDPAVNALYAAKFLQRLHAEENSWWKAAGNYHSRTKKYRERYLASLQRNHQAVKEDFQRLAAVGTLGDARINGVGIAGLPAPSVLWGEATQEQSGFSIYSRISLGSVLPAFDSVGLIDEQ